MNKNKIIWGVISVLIAALSIWMVIAQSRNFSLEILLTLIYGANKFWLVMAFVSMFGFIWFEGYAVVEIAECFGYKKSLGKGTIYGAADVYFSAITPSASGGQPASAYFMMKDGMSGASVTISLLLNLIMYTLALFFVGLISMLFGWHIFVSFSVIPKILIGIGVVILIGLTVLFWMLIQKADIIYGIADHILKFLEKLHLMRHSAEKREKLNRTMDDYRECARIITENKLVLIKVFFLNVFQRLSQLMVSFMVFMSMGRGLRESISAVFLQCFVALGSNSVPVPGSMGVADYMMLDGFRALVGVHDSVNMELLCRGITFYSCVLVGGLIVVIGYVLRRKRC